MLNIPLLRPKLSLLTYIFNGLHLNLYTVIFFELLDLLLHSFPIYVYFILEAIKFCIPSFSYVLLFNHAIKSILPDFFICIFVFIALHCSTDALFKIFVVIRHKVKSVTFIGCKVKLENGVLKATCPKSYDRSSPTEKLMLDYSTWLKHWRH